jgi:hypothetical protein
MKYNLSIEGDYYEDRIELETLITAADIAERNERAREYIRKACKHEDFDEKTDTLLEEITNILKGVH